MKYLIALLLASVALPAAAQSIQQSGPVTPGHVPVWVTDGVVSDSGTAAIPSLTSPLTSVGVVNNGGPGICLQSATSASPYNQLCLSASTSGAAQLTLQNYLGAPAQSLQFVLNGSIYTFPFQQGGNVIGPNSSIVGDVAIWNNSAGTLLADGTKTGNTTKFATASGNFTNQDCPSFDSNGNIIDAGNACALWTTFVSLGADPTGVIDATTIIQNAINSVGNGQQSFLCTSGTYKISNTITINAGTIHIIGVGPGACTITMTSNSADLFDFNGTTFDSSIEHVTLINTAPLGTQTSGCAISESNGVGNIRISYVRITAFFNGVCMTNSGVSGVVSIDHTDMAQIKKDSVIENGGSQLFIDTMTSYGFNGTSPYQTGACIHHQNGGGFYYQNVTCGGANEALLINPLSFASVFNGFITNFEADASTGTTAAVSFDSSGGGKIWDIRITNLRIGFSNSNPNGPSSTPDGLAFNGANTSNITLTNFTVNANAGRGIDISNIQNSQIIGGQILGNGAAGSTFHGIDIFNATDLLISGVRATAAYPLGSSNQDYGIVIENSFTGSLQIRDSDVRGNNVGGLFNAASIGSYTSLDIQGVTGYNPLGVKYPALGSSPWTYTPGPSPEYLVFSGGTCTSYTVGGVAVPLSSYAYVTFFVQPGQSVVGTCSVNPVFFSALAQ